jgi:hypothetical protein
MEVHGTKQILAGVKHGCGKDGDPQNFVAHYPVIDPGAAKTIRPWSGMRAVRPRTRRGIHPARSSLPGVTASVCARLTGSVRLWDEAGPHYYEAYV